MNRDLERCKNRLETENFTCVIKKGESCYTFTERGIRPLMSLLESGADLKGAVAADKVIGKAAALLMVKCRIGAVYAAVISEPAIRVLEDAGIGCEYGALVARIQNRRGDGLCPMESAVMEIADADEAYAALKDRLKTAK